MQEKSVVGETSEVELLKNSELEHEETQENVESLNTLKETETGEGSKWIAKGVRPRVHSPSTQTSPTTSRFSEVQDVIRSSRSGGGNKGC